MHKTSLFNVIKPYLTICTALILAITLLMDTFFFNVLAFHWLATLWFFLIFTLITMTIQVARTEKDIRSYSNQLLIGKERLTNEIKHRLWAEKTASESKTKSLFIDENIPVMLAYFNADLRCRYHNRIFRRWFGLNPSQIDGRLLTEFSGEEFFADIKNCIEEILAGKTIHNERILRSIKGFPYIFTEQYVPHLDNKGKTIGFYTVHTPRMQEKNHIPLKNKAENSIKTELHKINEALMKGNANPQNKTSKPEITTTASRIVQAIERGEFNLYYQQINSIKPTIASPLHYEILIRMNEEENNLMPPDSFLPFVDQFKMMPQLDRWIVSHIIDWLSVQPRIQSIFCLNVAKDTLNDHTFPSFTQNQLQKMNVAASNLCFEIEALDAETNTSNAIVFSRKISELGCLLSLCSFDHNPSSIELLDKMKVDYLKIDGSLICNILRDEEDLKKVISINQLAHKAGIKTIAELVETDDILAKLQEIGVDYAQGFGIAKTHPFRDL
ncbi:EAL domain-containing protein [Nitrosomonas sp. Nm166]|uniref:sensor domain-containing phosphodiesterase n=1 Tax=Nitrosomonas sp. Nm166 TaxID=1881054 RepID=UPI0008E97B43|nr:EAL domain-containing protein [Nitrosomonas sp. Nm166]SFD85091.1 EAL domain, c-di-GMP-specific phosphodiesterase class I (or its enzymatically inactive variant) [Nitrosomonas sp. Nm166]